MHVKALAAAGAFDRMLAFFDRQAQCGMAVLALAVAADLAVTETVTQIGKIVFDLLPDAEKLSVFLAALVNIAREISVNCP